MERIMTLHPQGKAGVNIVKKKYDQIANYILDTLQEHQEMTYQDLDKRAVADLSETFDGKVGWYVVSVKLDLEARGMIKRVPNSSPHRLQLV